MKVGLGWRICLRTGWMSWERRERGMWTRDRETGRRVMVTLEDGEAMMEKEERDEMESREDVLSNFEILSRFTQFIILRLGADRQLH